MKTNINHFTSKRQVAFAKFLISNPDANYNEASNELFGYPASPCMRRSYKLLVDLGYIESRRACNYPSTRKTAERITPEKVDALRKVLIENPSISIMTAGAMVGLTHSPAYKIHDSLVLRGEIKSHRTHRSVAVKKNPELIKC